MIITAIELNWSDLRAARQVIWWPQLQSIPKNTDQKEDKRYLRGD